MNDASPLPEFTDPLAGVAACSIHEHCQQHEAEHKWWMSERENRDVGEQGIQDWIDKYWDQYLLARWVEHVEGQKYWVEFGSNTFGLLKHPIRSEHQFFDSIYDHLKRGIEDLQVICWASNERLPLDPVRHILELFNVCGRRIPHRLRKTYW